jgi:hypothetical protein
MMSAIDWLHFITPFIVTAMIIALTSSIPVPSSWVKPFKLSDKPLGLKKILIGAIIVIALGWVLAYLAPHVMTPIIRVNMVAISQVILIFSLLAIVIVMIHRIIQKNNVLSMLFILAKRCLPMIITIIGKISSALLVLLLDSSEEARQKQKKLSNEKSAYKIPRSYMNKRGEYCGKNKSNWY